VPSPNVGPFLNWFVSMSATSANDIWAVGQHQSVFGTNQVYQTSVIHWDGSLWSVVPSPNLSQLNNYLFEVVGIAANDAWAVGFWDTGTELKTMTQHWDGTAWTVIPSPSGAGGYISELTAVAVVSPTDVWAAGQAFDGFFNFETLVERYSCAVPDPAPTVAAIAPTSGPAAAGNGAGIGGTNFAAGASVTIGGAAATGVVVNDATSIDATTPDLTPGTLNDVVVTNPDLQSGTLTGGFFADFWDVPSSDIFHDSIEKIFRNAITSGYGNGYYGIADSVTRAQMAVFLLKGEHGSLYTPPPCTGIFVDVACSPTPAFAVDWIEQLSLEGITAGCIDAVHYCPDNPITRAQMAVFLLKAEHGSAYAPPICAGIFVDVPCPASPAFPYSDWVEQLFSEAITVGCIDAVHFCPDDPSTRGQMAVFLVKTFHRP
jgi:hypothetical protein